MSFGLTIDLACTDRDDLRMHRVRHDDESLSRLVDAELLAENVRNFAQRGQIF